MARTKLKKPDKRMEALTDKQRFFVMEYVKDKNGARAATRAGFKSPGIVSGHLLKKPHIAAAIAHYQEQQAKKIAISIQDIIEQLYYCVTRTSDDLIDPNTGLLQNDLRKLSPRAKAAVESIVQKVHTWTDGNGEEHTEIRNEIKLVSKAAALDMAMKHKGLFAPVKVEGQVTLKWDELYGKERRIAAPPNVIPADALVRYVENRAADDAEARKETAYTVDELVEGTE